MQTHLSVSLQKSKTYTTWTYYHLAIQLNHDDLHFHDHACYHITSIITPFITIIFLPAGSAAQFAPGAGGIKLSCALSTSSPHNYHMLPQHIIHHYSHYQVGDHSFNLCEFSSHAIPTTVKSIIFVSFQKHAGLGSKPFFASIVSNNKYCVSGWFLRYSYYSSVIHSCI